MRRNRMKLVSSHLQTGIYSSLLTSCHDTNKTNTLCFCSAKSLQHDFNSVFRLGNLQSSVFCFGSGLITPGGFSSVPAGMETPELIELRKKKIEEAMDG